MSLYEILRKRLEEAETYIKQDSKAKSALKMIGKIKVNVKTTDTSEEIGATIGSDRIDLVNGSLEGPAITISGTSKLLKELVTKPSRTRFDDAQSKGQVKIESHGLKGKLVMSKVKDLLSQSRN